MQHPHNMIPPGVSRRAFLKASSALAAGAPLLAALLKAQSREARAPLMAYVGTFSSPLRDVLPTQVDLPPGNGRGIHLFQVNRTTGVMIPNGVHELETSPSCLALNAAGTRLYSANETDRKSTRLNSSHRCISYAVFCLKKKKKNNTYIIITNKSNL